MNVTFLIVGTDEYIHSMQVTNELRDEIVIGNEIKIKGNEYTIMEIIPNINGKLSLKVYLR